MKFLKTAVLAGSMVLFAINASASTVTFEGDLGKGPFSFFQKFSFDTLSTVKIELEDIKWGGYTLVDSNNTIIDSYFLPTKGSFTDTISPLAAGSYKAFFYGNSTKKGEWEITVSALPVPEANEAGMMLSGLAMLGLIAVRRRNNI